MWNNNIDLSDWCQLGTATEKQEIPKGMEIVTGFQILLTGIPQIHWLQQLKEGRNVVLIGRAWIPEPDPSTFSWFEEGSAQNWMKKEVKYHF